MCQKILNFHIREKIKASQIHFLTVSSWLFPLHLPSGRGTLMCYAAVVVLLLWLWCTGRFSRDTDGWQSLWSSFRFVALIPLKRLADENYSNRFMILCFKCFKILLSWSTAQQYNMFVWDVFTAAHCVPLCLYLLKSFFLCGPRRSQLCRMRTLTSWSAGSRPGRGADSAEWWPAWPWRILGTGWCRPVSRPAGGRTQLEESEEVRLKWLH